MPLKKLQITPGVNRENTRYTSEGGWYECDNVRFRQGYPEKIGGWLRTSANTFLGVCRSIWSWSSLVGTLSHGIGTHLKFYIDISGTFNDVTPIRATTSAGDVTFSASNGSSTLTVTDTAHGASAGSYVTYSGASSLGGLITADVLNHEYAILAITSSNVYTITATDTFGGSTVTANGSDSGDGVNTTGAYQINIGESIVIPLTGWGAGDFGEGLWGTGGTSEALSSLRYWNQQNFGEDLIAGVRRGELYIWDNSSGVGTRMTLLSAEGDASDVPTEQGLLLISDISRFVFVFGANIRGGSTYDPMLIRWSDKDSAVNWTPSATNEAGDLRLSRGSRIVAVKQARQEILIWTDIALYSLQYLGPPAGWGAQLVGENISISSSNAVAYSNGTAYWMGEDKFYIYTGQTQPLPCDLRRYVFSDINSIQYEQVFSGTNEAFNEIWWFYPSASSDTIDRYVIYNYLENIWYYGSMARTAWLDAAENGLPIAATYSSNIVLHEKGVDDATLMTPVAINAFILSSEFDIDDGDRFAFVWRILPDISFEGSTINDPSVDLTLLPLRGSGAGYNNPTSEGGVNTLPVARTATAPVEVYTNQLNIRIRGRQMSIKVASTDIGVQWQLGQPRIDLRADGRR